MDIISVLAKKRDGLKLSREEIEYFVQGAVSGRIADYQVSALLMAIRINGLTPEEGAALTESMTQSGHMLDLSDIPGVKVDKHSTGGVGDATTLILLPIAAAAGLKGAKMSGRGLGHTGGTLDKLEAIPGFRVDLPLDRFKQQLRDIGLAIVSQSRDLAPADKLFYALRDVTATVDSIPLIAASIMSKKLAIGADVLVLDVKYGSGAFVPTKEKGRELAQAMLAAAGKMRASAILSSMNQPLGRAVGNALEVREAVEVLEGRGPADLRRVSLTLAAEQIYLAGLRPDRAAAFSYAESLLDSGAARAKFAALVQAQGGDADFSHLPQAPRRRQFPAESSGYVAFMDAHAIGRAAALLGAGRLRAEDPVDPAAGLVLSVRIADRVEKGQPLAELHYGGNSRLEEALDLLTQAIRITPHPPQGREEKEELYSLE